MHIHQNARWSIWDDLSHMHIAPPPNPYLLPISRPLCYHIPPHVMWCVMAETQTLPSCNLCLFCSSLSLSLYIYLRWRLNAFTMNVYVCVGRGGICARSAYVTICFGRGREGEWRDFLFTVVAICVLSKQITLHSPHTTQWSMVCVYVK